MMPSALAHASIVFYMIGREAVCRKLKAKGLVKTKPLVFSYIKHLLLPD